MKRYYSPQIDRDLVSALDHEAKARGIPMTRLANRLLLAALGYEGVERDNEARKDFQVYSKRSVAGPAPLSQARWPSRNR